MSHGGTHMPKTLLYKIQGLMIVSQLKGAVWPHINPDQLQVLPLPESCTYQHFNLPLSDVKKAVPIWIHIEHCDYECSLFKEEQ
jgi:hypothetical protein